MSSAPCALFERAGANAIQLEDQDFPKRCGHLDGKALIPADEMAGKIKAALDARRSRETLIDRAHRCGRGRGLRARDRARRRCIARPAPTCCSSRRRKTRDELARIVAALGAGVPLMANMVEGGKTPLLSAAELEAIGFALVIFPGGIVRALAQHRERLLRLARRARHAPSRSATACSISTALNALIGTPEMIALGKRYEAPAPSGKKTGAPVKPLDPVTLAVLNGRLVQIADEMDATLYRSAFNPIIAEAHDACHGLYHAETGATLVQGTSGLPIFVGAMAFAVKAVIDKVARDGDLAAGDTYLFNDPYDGGTHLNDFRLVRPLMRDGKVFAWLASVGHWLDVGGNVPGNFNAKATESFQEGFRIPPVKLVRAGVLQQDIVDILAANSRVPQSNWGDLNGQLNALDLGERRLHALLDEYGDDTIAAALAALTRARRDADARQHRGAAGRHLLAATISSTTTASPTSRCASRSTSRSPATA